MTVRRLLLGVATGAAAFAAWMPSAHADAACAWVDPYGVCVSNPIPDLPDLPDAPRVPRIPRLP